MEKEKISPDLRFPGFEGEWSFKTMESVSSRIGDGLHGTPEYNDSSDIYFINGNNLCDGRIIVDKTTKKVSYEVSRQNDKNLNNETLLISINGTIGSIARYCNEKIMLGKSVGYFNLKYNRDFFFHLLQSNPIQRFFVSELTGTTIKNLSLKTLRETKICIPQKQEQQKIASFLTAVDKRITLLTQKKEKLEKYKKGVMQKIFNREIRFKDDLGRDLPEWEEKKLGDVGITFNGLTSKTKEDFGDGKSYIQYMQIFSNSRIDITQFGLVKIIEGENQNRVKRGDIFFTTSSETPDEIGTASVLLDEVDEVYLNSFCFGFRPNSIEELMPEFTQYLFRSLQFRKKIEKLAQGSTRFNMSKVELMKLSIQIPNNSEQRKIASFLTALDKQVEAVTGRIDKMKQWKKGLLQKMFV